MSQVILTQPQAKNGNRADAEIISEVKDENKSNAEIIPEVKDDNKSDAEIKPKGDDKLSDAKIIPEDTENQQTCLNFCCELFFCEDYHQVSKKPDTGGSGFNLQGAAFLTMNTVGAHRNFSHYSNGHRGSCYSGYGGGCDSGGGDCGGGDGDCGGGDGGCG